MNGVKEVNMEKKQQFLALAAAHFGEEGEFKNQEMLEFAAKQKNFEKRDWNWLFNADYKVDRGLYRLPALDAKNRVPVKEAAEAITVPAMVGGTTERFNPNAQNEFGHSQIPQCDKHYVPFGDFKDVETIIKSGVFFPIFIWGMSGNGKTFMAEQACARSKRPMVRVQMSRETDEDDLIGGFRLIDGETKFMKGPVLSAMETGSLLLIDEADRADPGKVMCLQGILEGKPYFVKKTGEVIVPRPGFNVIVTANTQGKGSDDGRFSSAGILDEAWLERFPITIAQMYPSSAIEKRILTSYLKEGQEELSEDHQQFIKQLIAWADIIRKTFAEDGINEVISTRRLVHIIKTFKMFDNQERAIQLCTNRFDEETRNSFLELYSKVVETNSPKAAEEKAESAEEDDYPF